MSHNVPKTVLSTLPLWNCKVKSVRYNRSYASDDPPCKRHIPVHRALHTNASGGAGGGDPERSGGCLGGAIAGAGEPSARDEK